MASFGCILHKRHVFSRRLFRREPFSAHIAETEESVDVYCLKSGQSHETDRFLDAITASFEPLKKGWLQAIVVIVTPDVAKPSYALETYTVQIAYEGAGDSQTASIETREEAHKAIRNFNRSSKIVATRRDVDTAMSTVLKALQLSTPSMGRLPLRKRIRVELVYTDTCPQDYQPNGYIAATEGSELPLITTSLAPPEEVSTEVQRTTEKASYHSAAC